MTQLVFRYSKKNIEQIKQRMYWTEINNTLIRLRVFVPIRSFRAAFDIHFMI